MDCISFYGDIIFCPDLERNIIKFRPDIIHIHTILHGLSYQAALISTKHKIPYVCDSHDFLFDGHPLQPFGWSAKNILKYVEFKYIRKWLSLYILHNAKKIISVNPASTKLLSYIYNVQPSVVEKTYLSVDTSLFTYARQPTKQACVVIPGIMTSRKKPELYLKILEKIKTKDIKFIFFGFDNPSTAKNFFRQAKENNTIKKIKVVGILTPKKVAAILNQSTLGLLLYSGSISILECMACGLPVLYGPNQMKFLLDKNFLVKKVFEFKKIAAKIDLLLKNKKKLSDNGHQNAEKVHKQASANYRYKKLYAIYQKAILTN